MCRPTIVVVRGSCLPVLQAAFGVPAEAMRGHAWHTYTLTSADGSVAFEFKHNVNGRRTCAMPPCPCPDSAANPRCLSVCGA